MLKHPAFLNCGNCQGGSFEFCESHFGGIVLRRWFLIKVFMNKLNGNLYSLLTGVIIGSLYGISTQFIAKSETFKDVFAIMSMGFVFVLPICLGAITIYFAPDIYKKSWGFRIFMPWATSVVCLILALLTGLEGTICLIMAIPIYVPLSSVGGIIMGLVYTHFNFQKLNAFTLGFIFVLPFLVNGIEEQYPTDDLHKQVNTSILIQSSPKNVWNHITRIPKITEPQYSFFYLMGFPRPVEATLSFEGVGGVREAKFEKGLLFLEKITKWEPEKKLTFTIQADPQSTPLTTLDSHVTVGGRYFDTLLGEYEIEKINDSEVRLHLFSRYRLSTRFNFYAEIWSDFLMRDIQENILRVLKSRAEKQ